MPPAQVLTATQRLFDRALFIAFAEDRELLPTETLKKAYEHRDLYRPRPVWDNFRALFRAIDLAALRSTCPATPDEWGVLDTGVAGGDLTDIGGPLMEEP